MNNPAAVLTAYQIRYDGTKQSAVLDAGYTQRRLQLLGYLQQIYEYIENYAEWEWTFDETSFNVTAGNDKILLSTAIPNFLEFGREGGIFDTARRVMMRETSRFRVMRQRYLQSGGNQVVDAFTLFQGYIQFPSTFTTTTALMAVHRVVPEALADNATVFLLPEKYVESVLLSGLVWKAQKTKNDQRTGWGDEVTEGLTRMMAQENPNKTTPARMPLSRRGVW